MPWPIRFGPRPEDDHRGPLARRDLGLLVVGGVVVRRAAPRTRPRRCRRSCRPGGCRARCRSAAHAVLAGQFRRSAAIWRSEKPCRLAARSSVGVEHRRVDAARSRPRPPAAIWSTNHGSIAGGLGDLLDGGAQRAAPARRRRAGRRWASAAASSSSSTRRRVGLGPVKPARLASPASAAPCCSASVKLRPDRHRLADRLHRGGQRRVGAGELLEGEPRHLDHDVVERRLEGGRGLLVMSLGISSRV